MSYDYSDTSTHDGSPIECYKFVGTGGTYRYTDADEEVTVNGETYEPLNITRTPFEIGSVLDSVMTIDVTVPTECDLAQAFALLQSRDNLDLEVRRVHRGTNYDTDWGLVWKGYTLFYTSSGRMTTFQTGTVVQAALSGKMNTVYYQTACNHVLFDGRCKVVKADWTTASVVTAIDGNEVTVVDDGVDNNVLRAGEIINLRTGERRFVLGNALNVIDVGFPFNDLVIGDEVQMVAGCNHSFSECGTKFDNIANYGGYPYVPSKNPFNGDV